MKGSEGVKQSGKVALGGVLGALSLVCMLLTIFPYATYALPALAGAVLIPIVVEMGVKWSFLVYASVALLSLIVAPEKEAAILFAAFFGYYPTLKAVLEKLKSRVAEWGIKLAVFNATMVAAYMLLLFVFNLDPESFELFGVNLPLVFLALGNVVFVIYDFALTNVISLYIQRLHPRFSHMFK